jgi:hypothetical protein
MITTLWIFRIRNVLDKILHNTKKSSSTKVLQKSRRLWNEVEKTQTPL